MEISKMMPMLIAEFALKIKDYGLNEIEVAAILNLLKESERIILRKLLDED